jgi:hypothetical protein
MKRDELKRSKDPNAMTYLDCSNCVSRMTDAARAGWRCGWMPEEQRAGKLPLHLTFGIGETSDLCPGYLIALPQVIEAANAHTCWKEGQLADAYPTADRTAEGLLLSCVLTLNQALGEAEADAMAKVSG